MLSVHGSRRFREANTLSAVKKCTRKNRGAHKQGDTTEKEKPRVGGNPQEPVCFLKH